MNIIGISGKAGSGKDTVTSILLENKSFTSIAFADPIKRFAMDIWNFNYDQLWGPSQNRSLPDERYPIGNGEYLSPRKVLQHVGEECARALERGVWVRYALNIAKILLTEDNLSYSPVNGIQIGNNKFSAVIISDCRYINELSAIKESGGKLIKIIRPGSGLDGDFAKHRSENDSESFSDDDYDFIINNNGTLDNLKEKVGDIVKNIL